ncbi:hypothetical protein TrST_g749 [Triparma strigata]|uniref:Uncharacterized protein n=1 Tax=Triparma strigata TaxID=1606541 RepID=A0A9W7A6C8_9STRA|nr:hypothetical protein TrST_g749 [Triparma strigata]
MDELPPSSLLFHSSSSSISLNIPSTPLTTSTTSNPLLRSTPSTLGTPTTTATATANISTATARIPPPTYVTDAATQYSVLTCLITCSFTLLYFYRTFFASGLIEAEIRDFWLYVMAPLCLTATNISFVLKPRRRDLKYRVFLISQYVIFTFFCPIFSVISNSYSAGSLMWSGFFLVPALIMLYVGLWFRNLVAELSDEDLDRFITQDVVKGGVFVGLGQLVFLIFSCLQCYSDHFSTGRASVEYNVAVSCERALLSQVGLSYMVWMFSLVKLFFGALPKSVLRQNIVPLKKVVIMRLNRSQKFQTWGIFVAGICALYPLGNYGSEGHVKIAGEKAFSVLLPACGCVCLFATALWTFKLVRRDMNRNTTTVGTLSGIPRQRSAVSNSDDPEELLITGASNFWFYTGVAASMFQPILLTLAAITLDDYFETLGIVTLPFVLLVYSAALISQPRRRDTLHMHQLRALFVFFSMGSEIAMMVYRGRRREWALFASHLFRAFLHPFAFHFGLKLRASIGRLPDEELDAFVVDTLFRGGVKTLLSILFLTFRTTKCMFELGSVERCKNVSFCSSILSIYLLLWWIIGLVQGSVRREWRKDVTWSIEKLATVKNLGPLTALELCFFPVAAVSSIYLLSTLYGEKNGKVASEFETIYYISIAGVLALCVIGIIEIYSSIKAQKRIVRAKTSQTLNKSQVEEEEEEEEEGTVGEGAEADIVEEVNGVYVFFSFVLTTTTGALSVCRGILYDRLFFRIMTLIAPIASLSLFLAFFCKPKRTDAAYKQFLRFHCASACLLHELGVIIYQFKPHQRLLSRIFFLSFSIFRVLVAYKLFSMLLKLRDFAARLPPKELSKFLCNRVLVKGVFAMGPLLFFSFETISCYLRQDKGFQGFNVAECNATTDISLFLSLLLVFLTIYSVMYHTLPKDTQNVISWDYRSVATLKLVRWQQLQSILLSYSAAIAMYLLSYMGVEGEDIGSIDFGYGPFNLIFASGVTSLISLSFAMVIGMRQAFRISREDRRRAHSKRYSVRGSSGGVSTGDIEDSMALAIVI